ncbi:MAG: hypothetical protein L0177_20165 [Chloroflexi bacterium]|nr:hypothetical protein [Chloroflexota bacterium]
MFTLIPLLLASSHNKADAFSTNPLPPQVSMERADSSVFSINAEDAPIINLQSGEVGVGESISMPVVLSVAPGGLAGYLIEVEMKNPAVASIVGVEFPSFGLTNQSQVGGTSRLAAADLMRVIEVGDTDATLVTLNIQGLAFGTSEMEIRIIQMDDDKGNLVEASTLSGIIRVK